jgi:hypothetical protein
VRKASSYIRAFSLSKLINQIGLLYSPTGIPERDLGGLYERVIAGFRTIAYSHYG